MNVRLLKRLAVLSLAALPLAACYIGPAGRVRPAVYVRPAPVYVGPPPAVVVPRPYGY
jgi:hypothetical protein